MVGIAAAPRAQPPDGRPGAGDPGDGARDPSAGDFAPPGRFVERLDNDIRAIGKEIFERADAARPRVWQHAWWLEQMIRVDDRDDRLRTRAFQCVDCLPALRDNDSLARHLHE